MGENTQEKNLIKKEKVSLFGKIKNFFKNLFGKKQAEVNDEPEVVSEESNNQFIDYIKMTEDEETKLLELQRKYRRGEIAENDLTDEQIDALCNLYDKQINDLKVSIKIKEDKISEYNKRRIENNNA
ncbi:MAG: hypothetical protein IJE68_02595 [Clostridia bacterium]|nr:hypothetical protein [Clostridia bacterium]